MKRMMLSAAVSVSALAAAEPLDALVETSNGDTAHLARVFKKPTVLFYEDRDSNRLNQHVKDALIKAGRERGLTQSVDVVAVANVAAYNWFPARNFVLAAVRDIEREVKIPIYLDFTGALGVAPWKLPTHSSTVLVMSPAGEPLMLKKGRLSDTEVTEIFTLLERLIGDRETANR